MRSTNKRGMNMETSMTIGATKVVTRVPETNTTLMNYPHNMIKSTSSSSGGSGNSMKQLFNDPTHALKALQQLHKDRAFDTTSLANWEHLANNFIVSPKLQQILGVTILEAFTILYLSCYNTISTVSLSNLEKEFSMRMDLINRSNTAEDLFQLWKRFEKEASVQRPPPYQEDMGECTRMVEFLEHEAKHFKNKASKTSSSPPLPASLSSSSSLEKANNPLNATTIPSSIPCQFQGEAAINNPSLVKPPAIDNNNNKSSSNRSTSGHGKKCTCDQVLEKSKPKSLQLGEDPLSLSFMTMLGSADKLKDTIKRAAKKKPEPNLLSLPIEQEKPSIAARSFGASPFHPSQIFRAFKRDGTCHHQRTQQRHHGRTISWSFLTREESDAVRNFWFDLGPIERKKLIKQEKDLMTKLWREQVVYPCSCSYCQRKKLVVEEEIEHLYHAYHTELESTTKTTMKSSTKPTISEIFMTYEDVPIPSESIGLTLQTPTEKECAFRAALMSIADDLLQNDGRRFLNLFEKLAERRIKYEKGPRNPHRHYHSQSECSDTEDGGGYDEDEDDGADDMEMDAESKPTNGTNNPHTAEMMATASSSLPSYVQATTRKKAFNEAIAYDEQSVLSDAILEPLLKHPRLNVTREGNGIRFYNADITDSFVAQLMKNYPELVYVREGRDLKVYPGPKVPDSRRAKPLLQEGGSLSTAATAMAPGTVESSSGHSSPCVDYEEEFEDEEDELVFEEEQIHEGRRIFQVIAAKTFEQRIILAYRETVAMEKLRQMVLDEENEEKERKERELAKSLANQRKKQKKKAAKMKDKEAAASAIENKEGEEEILLHESKESQEIQPPPPPPLEEDPTVFPVLVGEAEELSLMSYPVYTGMEEIRKTLPKKITNSKQNKKSQEIKTSKTFALTTGVASTTKSSVGVKREKGPEAKFTVVSSSMQTKRTTVAMSEKELSSAHQKPLPPRTLSPTTRTIAHTQTLSSNKVLTSKSPLVQSLPNLPVKVNVAVTVLETNPSMTNQIGLGISIVDRSSNNKDPSHTTVVTSVASMIEDGSRHLPSGLLDVDDLIQDWNRPSSLSSLLSTASHHSTPPSNQTNPSHSIWSRLPLASTIPPPGFQLQSTGPSLAPPPGFGLGSDLNLNAYLSVSKSSRI